MGEAGPAASTVRVRAVADSQVTSIDIIVDGCVVAQRTGNEVDELLPVGQGRHFIYARTHVPPTTSGENERRAWTSPVYLGNPEN